MHNAIVWNNSRSRQARFDLFLEYSYEHVLDDGLAAVVLVALFPTIGFAAKRCADNVLTLSDSWTYDILREFDPLYKLR